ncbi:probable G-protein coupled receptor Mth-like 12 isoform X2 [Drosophila suzukii]
MWQSLILAQMWSSAPESVRVVSFIFSFAHSMWLSVISYHLSWPYKSVNGEEHSFLFRAYNVFVWVPTAVLLGSPALIYNLYGESNIVFDFLACAFLAFIISNFFNSTVLILTINHILKLKRQTVKLRQRDGETTTCLNLDSEIHSYLYCRRILFVIVLPWFTLIGYISTLIGFRHPVLYVVGFINASYGIWYFILLILNRYTLRLLMDRFRGSPNKQFVGAQMVNNPA